MICIGINACNQSYDHRCSVALGDNIQLPEGRIGDHVLVTKNGVRRLSKIDAKVIHLMVAEAERVRDEDPSVRAVLQKPVIGFSVEYIDQWNKACSE